jgi:O-antigen/teichoic acid export membrane protein
MKRALSVLVGGNVAGQLVTILSTLVIARLYSSADYGQLAIVMSLSATIASASHGRFHLALGSNVGSDRAVGIVRVALSTTFLANLLCAIGLLAIGRFTAVRIDVLTVTYTVLIAAGTSILEVSSYWRSYRGDHVYTARMTIARALLTPMAQAALFPLHEQGLVLGMAASLYIVVGMAAWRELVGRSPLLSAPFKLRHLRRMAWHYRDFPMYSLPQGILTSLAFNAVPLVMGAYASRSAVGQYWLAYRILLAPVAIFGNAYRQVFLTRSSKSADGAGTSARIALTHTAYAAAVLIPVGLVLLVAAPSLFTFAYGEHWQLAGEFAAWFGLIMATTIIKVPAVSRLQSLRCLRLLLGYEVVTAIAKLALFWLVVRSHPILDAIAAYAIVSGLLNLVMIPIGIKEKPFERKSSRK